MKPKHALAGKTTGLSVRPLWMALVVAGGLALGSAVLAANEEPDASADAEAKAEAKEKAREQERDNLIELFDEGKAQYRAGDLDAARKTFKEVQAKLGATGLNINSLFVRRDPDRWLKRIAEAEAERKAEAAADRKRAGQLFEEAKKNLQAGNLDAAEAGFKKVKASGADIKVDEWLTKVDAAREQRRTDARAIFDQAKKDLEAGNLADAEAGFNKVKDTGLDLKVETWIERVEQAKEQHREKAGERFKQAKRDLEAGNLDEAEAGFKEVKKMGVDLSTFWRRNDPDEWLEEVTEAKAERQAEAEANRKRAGQLLERAKLDLKAGRLAAAEAGFKQVKATGVDLKADEWLNKVADAKAKRQSEIAAKRKQAQTLFDQAKKDLAAGNLDAAEDGFKQVQATGVDLGADDWLEKVAQAKADRAEERLAKQRDAQRLFDQAREDLEAGNLDKAEAGFKQVKDAGVDLNVDEWLEKVADAKTRREVKLAAAKKGRQDKLAEAQKLLDQAKKDLEAGHLDKAEQGFRKVKDTGFDLKADEWLEKVAQARKDLREKARKRFDEAVADFEADRLKEAEVGFNEVKKMGVDLSTFWRRNDPDQWLQKVTDRRAELKAEEDRRQAQQEAEKKRREREQKQRRAEADLAAAHTLAQQHDKDSLAQAQAKAEAALASGVLSADQTAAARKVVAEMSLALGRRKAFSLLGKAEGLATQARDVVMDPMKMAPGRGHAGARDALRQAAKDARAAKDALLELQTISDSTSGDVLTKAQLQAFHRLMGTVDGLIAKAEAEAKRQDDLSKFDAAIAEEEIEAQRNRVLARSHVDAGDQAAAQGDWTAAKSEYQKAVNLDPENTEAQTKLVNARRELGERPRPTIEEVRDIKVIEWQRFVIEMRRQLNEAQALMRAQEFERARTSLDLLLRQIDRGGWPEGDVQDYRAAARQLRDQALFQIKRREEKEREREMKEAAERERIARDRFRSLRAEKVQQLIEQANAYVRQREYDLAFQAAEEALKLDPPNVEAKIIRDQSQMWSMQTRSKELRHKRDLEIAKMIMDVEESRIPHSDVVTYPEDWVELSVRRKKYDVMRVGPKETPAVERIRQQLDKPVTIEFPDTSFENVINFIQDLTGVNIVVDRKAILAEGIGPDTTIKLKLTNVRLESALNLILEQVNLDYVIKDESIFITNAEGVGRDLEVRVYDVRDLVVAMGEHGGDDGNNGNRGNNGNESWWNSGRNRNSNGLRGLDNTWDDGGFDNEGNGGQTTGALMGNLSTLIQRVVKPESWTAVTAAGGQASIEPFRDEMLIISQTPKVHDEIWDLLAQLRAFLSLQVVIEARLIKVADDFIEDMGIDWDATLNLRDASILPDGTPRAWPDKGADRWAVRHTNRAADQPLEFDAAGNPVPGGRTLVYDPWGVTDETLFPSYSSSFSPVDINLNLPAVSALTGGIPVLTVGPVGFLDDISVNFTLAFAQKSFRATVMTAPRVTLMSGGSANINISTQQRYVQSLRPVVDEGVVGYEPVLADAPVSSVDLSIDNCAVSHDRKYVRLSISPSLQTAEFEEEREIFSVAVPSGNGGAGEPLVLTGTIQTPLVTSTSVSTDVSVPDGGTVLLGGLRTSTEQEQEEGVPILSKIPIIKRLFTRRFEVRRQTNVILLIKPTIIIPDEEEEKLGLVVD